MAILAQECLLKQGVKLNKENLREHFFFTVFVFENNYYSITAQGDERYNNSSFWLTGCNRLTIEQRHEKTNVLVSDHVRHKPGCTATEDG